MSTVSFTITNQQHEWTFGDTGREGQWIVTFQTANGWTSQVVVPDSAYTPENVAAMIAAEASNIDAIGSIQTVETD